MKITRSDLLDVIYRYYPRGVGLTDGDIDAQAIDSSEEHARLVAARQTAAHDERWPALQRRIEERFPEAPLRNDSLHLLSGRHDACYSFTLALPGAAPDRALSFQVSFLAPCYIIHRSGTTQVERERRTDSFLVTLRGVNFDVARSPFDRDLITSLDDESLKPATFERRHVTFDLLPEQRPYAEWIGREIEATFGCEPMPEEIGTMLVPDLATPKLPGEVRIFDCLFSDAPWVAPAWPDEPSPCVSVDACSLTAPFAAVLTVLAAMNTFAVALMIEAQLQEGKGFAAYWVMETDGVLRKEATLKSFEMARLALASVVTPRGVSAMREFEDATRDFRALMEAWDGQGAPPPAMVAWASSLLDSAGKRWRTVRGGVSGDELGMP